MATQAYWDWVSAGRPWQLAKPVSELAVWAAGNDVDILGTIGDEGHLQAGFPEDHTPFSFTAWPVPLPGYYVCAIDLADVRGLGVAILAGARSGSYPWLKYMNFAGRNYSFADGFQAGSPNSDHHIHLSVFSDDLDTSIGLFDPWGVSVEPSDRLPVPGWMQENWPQLGDTMWVQSCLVSGYGHSRRGKEHAGAAVRALREVNGKLDAITSSLEKIVPGVAEAAAQAVAEVQAADVAEQLEVTVKEE